VAFTKTHTSACVLIPPEAVWGPIQAIRRAHDRQLRRWMPHITLLYPFVPAAAFDGVTAALAQACANVAPFRLGLARFDCFHHGRGRYTLWLAPEPGQPVVALQQALWQAVPECDDTGRFAAGYRPHLSVGQVQGDRVLGALIRDLQAAWRTLDFRVESISLIRRGDPPHDVFVVDRSLRLGPRSQGGGRLRLSRPMGARRIVTLESFRYMGRPRSSPTRAPGGLMAGWIRLSSGSRQRSVRSAD
jgi:2'-5' RNA ligase